MDRKQITVLVRLDLSKTFNSINKDMGLEKLKILVHHPQQLFDLCMNDTP